MSQDLFGQANVSRSVFARCPDQLRLSAQDIVAAAMRNNPQHQVTGGLLVGEPPFAPMPKGPRWAVAMAIEVVCRAPCNREGLFALPLTRRRICKWQMADASLPDGAAPDRVVGVTDYPNQIGVAACDRDLVQDLRGPSTPIGAGLRG